MTTKTKPELISFKLCPFVQRSVITLLEKKADFDITFIELDNKPDWFLKISPLGKVPVLKVDDQVLFESAVINEYLDEVNPPSIHPQDPLQKAQNRAWIEFSSTLFMSNYFMTNAKDEEEYNKRKEELVKGLSRLEEQLGKGKFFNGDEFSLVDTAYAPFFMRYKLNQKFKDDGILNDLPKVKEYSENLLAKESVQKSVVDNFEELYNDQIKKSGAFLGRS